MLLSTTLVIVLNLFKTCSGVFFSFDEVSSNILTVLPANLSLALKDIVKGLPTDILTIVRGNSTKIRNDDLYQMISILYENEIQVINMNLNEEETKNNYYEYLSKALALSVARTSLILCAPYECENILIELTQKNYIHRNILYFFYWEYGAVSQLFLETLTEAMRVGVIINQRENVFRIYYNQASSAKLHHLTLVNWWSQGRLYQTPVLPPPGAVYHDFQRRVFHVPVLHAPPWHFVQYNNDSTINVIGGRDDKLLGVLAEKLNFRYKYYDPPDRSQGSGKSANGTFKGTLGLVWQRKVDFFVGDVTMTWERVQGVEFSFLTLADSGAFVTHAPSKINEALALIRPFKWDVWPILVATLMAVGPALWFVIATPALWRRSRRVNQKRLLAKCCWFTTTLFLRQSAGKEPSSTHKARLVAVLMSLGATYVIGDMYSANLTSLMARPAREQPIGTLQALEEAMRDRGYELVVEQHSSSMAILQNGTGVYGRLARLMRRQRIQIVKSVERGVRLVLQKKTVAVLGGRETLYYDTKRFGANNFHLSEKLYTRYSAIALQIGCPYIENFNNVVMKLFEAGILTKMTTDEYEKLGSEKRTDSVAETEANSEANLATATPPQSENSRGLEPVSLRMLRGAFILLGAGHLLAAITFLLELEAKRRSEKPRNFKKLSENIPQKNVAWADRVLKVKLASFNAVKEAIAPSPLTLEYVN